jgi:dCMP deaminase
MLQSIYQIIKQNKKQNKKRLDWDEYFMSIALLVSCRSPCERLHVGCVIVKNNRIISVGYNGFISGAIHQSRILDGHEQSIIHSEINAITDCAKRGASLDNATIYITHYPCINCFRSIAACGIKKVYFLENYNNNELVTLLAKDANIEIIQLNFENS